MINSYHFSVKKLTFSLSLLVLFNLNFLQAQDCDFKEAGGFITVEAESASIPDGWIISAEGDNNYLAWGDKASLNEPGQGIITYKLNVTKPGLYRLQMRNRINEGTSTSNNNDSFLKLPNTENVVFFGHKGNSNFGNIESDLAAKNTNIVFPVGTGLGNPVFGPSKDGWVKIYANGLDWNWNIFMNDEDPYKIYVKFKAAGVYEMSFSAREAQHAIDKFVFYEVQTNGNDLSQTQLDSLQESANNCPKTIPSVNNGDGKCEFDEVNGVIAIEAESNNIPENWAVSLVDGTSIIEWTDSESFGKPGLGTITYTINVTTTGIYRFQWRNRVNKGNATNENNDTWLKMPNNENFVFFGYQGNGNADVINSDLTKKATTIVFPKGTNLGNPAAGQGGDGWVKIFTGGLKFNWTTNVNDENPYNVYAKINKSGLYTIQLSGRSKFHAIDKMVLYHLKTQVGDDGNELPSEVLDGFGESACVPKLPYTNNSQGDSLALRLLYEKTSGANWTNKWDLTKPMNQWAGVTLSTDSTRRVVQLSLVNRGMNGTLPSEMSFLSKLTRLEITGNGQLTGRIPELDRLVDLNYLDCSNNGGLGGNLAPIGNLTKLTVIKLANNKVSGGLPDDINKLVNLTTLDLSNNTISSDIPAGINSLTKLTTLNFANNAMTGNIPNLGALTGLKTLDLSGNDFTGVIGGIGLGNLANLELLDLGGNELTGPIFPGVVTLVKLTKLDLGGNQLSDSIPAAIGNLTALTNLNLSDNQLIGPIPASVASLVNLTTALFSNNQLDGNVPSLSGLTKLTSLSLHDNSLSGLPNLSTSPISDLSVENNKLTFEDIMPNLSKLSTYAPQDSVGERQSVTLVAGQDLLIDLGIDDGINSSIYQWNKNGVFFANSLKSELLIQDVGVQHLGVYTCVITNPQLPSLTLYSLPVEVKVNEPPAFTSAPVLEASSDSTYNYNIEVIDPNTDDSVAIEATQLPAWLTFTDNGNGTASLTGQPGILDCGDNQVSLRAFDKGNLDSIQSFSIKIAAKFEAAITASDSAICKGEAVTFTAGLTNPGPNPVYNWILNDQPLEGVNASTITTSSLKTGDVLKLTVTTDSVGCLVNKQASAAPKNIEVTEITTMNVILNPEQTQVCAGETASFGTFLSNPGDNPVYQWFVNGDSVINATSATFASEELSNGDAVKVRVNAENTGCMLNTQAESEAKTVTVVESFSLDVSLAADKTEAKAGDPVKFTATTTYNSSPITYQWFLNDQVVENETTATFISSTLQNNDKIKVQIVADSVPCLLNPEVESETITMTIDAGILLENLEKTTPEESPLTFASTDFADAFTSSLGELAKIKVTVLPTQGTLQLNGTNVTVGQEIAIDNLGGLVYTPNTDYSGDDGFQWNGSQGTQYGISDANVSITVMPVNDAPVFTLDRDTIVVNQGFTSTEVINVIPGEVPASEADQTITYSIDPQVPFANVTIDQTNGTISITKIGGRVGKQIVAVTANDGQAENNTYSQSFLIEIRSNMNTAPLDITLNSFNIPENQPVGSTIATINVLDHDPDDEHQIVFVDNDAFPDNAMFTIEGNELKNNQVLNFEEKTRMFVKLKATDKVGYSLSKQLVINITNVNDAPADIMISSLNVVENLSIGEVVAEFSAEDQDPNDRHTFELVGEASGNSHFIINGNKLVSNTTMELNLGDEIPINVRVSDGNEGGSIEKAFTLTVITPANLFADIKTGFTPNGDEWNATWKITGIENYPNAKVEIYDSWGRRIFYSEGYQQEWDGTFEGKELPSGTYYYIIDTFTGKPAKGSITLMR